MLALDGLNPQVAGRMTNLLRRCYGNEPVRRELMLAQLSRIVGHEALFKDVFEIVSKNL